MLFVSSGAEPDLALVDICREVAADAPKGSTTAFYNKLAEFRLDNAHCHDPNEVCLWFALFLNMLHGRCRRCLLSFFKSSFVGEAVAVGNHGSARRGGGVR